MAYEQQALNLHSFYVDTLAPLKEYMTADANEDDETEQRHNSN